MSSIEQMLMGAAAAPPADDDQDDVTVIIREALELVRQYAQDENDDQNVLLAEKIATQLQQILANEQKEAEGMLQGKASSRLLRQAYGA